MASTSLPKIPRVTLIREISRGSWGIVYLGRTESGAKVAVKTESRTCVPSQLEQEESVYRYLHKCTGFPDLKDSGKTAKVRFIVLDLLGRNLFELFAQNDYKFPVKTVLLIAGQMLQILETFHQKNHVHCDIKPGNMAIGQGRMCKQLFLFDFGFARRYRLSQTRGHIPYGTKCTAGTSVYASVNTHLGIKQTRRDDLESLGYVLIFFLLGDLPWMSVQLGTTAETDKKIALMKSSIKPEDLCHDLPEQFAQYLNYCRGLKFEETPNYEFLRTLFKELFQSMGFADELFVWDEK